MERTSPRAVLQIRRACRIVRRIPPHITTQREVQEPRPRRGGAPHPDVGARRAVNVEPRTTLVDDERDVMPRRVGDAQRVRRARASAQRSCLELAVVPPLRDVGAAKCDTKAFDAREI